ncbi:MAG: sigma-70 family RNA polymerase sigma factor [Saprospiraceae bacterium]
MAAANNIEQIFTTHQEKLRRDLLKIESNSDLIDDILQDAFIKLYININKKILNPEAWLYRVSRNLLTDHYRNKKKVAPLSHNEIQYNNVEKEHGPEDCLIGIISKLPEKYKKAVYLTDIKGIPQTESSKKLKLSLPTFKSHVQRGRKLVAQGYVECCDYFINKNGHLQGEHKDWKDCKVCSL